MINNLMDLTPIRNYLNRVSAEAGWAPAAPVGMRSAAITAEERTGYTRTRLKFKLLEDGAMRAYFGDGRRAREHEPTEEEAKDIAGAVAAAVWPQLQLLPDSDKMLLNRLARAGGGAAKVAAALRDNPHWVYINRNHRGQIVWIHMRQQEAETGRKFFTPWTFWSDDVWRMQEPDGPKTLFGAERLNDGYGMVVVHEGEKAARRWHNAADIFAAKFHVGAGAAIERGLELELNARAQEDYAWAEKHPWWMELRAATHVAWGTGALRAKEADWAELNGSDLPIDTIVLAPDNDKEGREAIATVLEAIHRKTLVVQYPNWFPAKFDLADDWPELSLSQMIMDEMRLDSRMRDYCVNRTWMTNPLPTVDENGKTRVKYALREHVQEEFDYIIGQDKFVQEDNPRPEHWHPPETMRRVLANRIHSDAEIGSLVARYRTRDLLGITYMPGRKKYEMDPGQRGLRLNIWTRPDILPEAGPAPTLKPGELPAEQPFLDFMAYLIPNENDRYQMYRWMATIIGVPGLHMRWGVAMVSRTQGIGKSTLGAKILAPLVGQANCCVVKAEDILSQFNDWIAEKQLMLCNELYEHSMPGAPYDALKALVDDRIMVNRKYIRAYDSPICCHGYVCSNHENALWLPQEDRRWFLPELTQEKWPKERYAELYAWLNGVGLQAICNWAARWQDYVLPGEEAPTSETKKRLQTNSKGEGQMVVIELAEKMKEFGLDVDGGGSAMPVALTHDDIEKHLEARMAARARRPKRPTFADWLRQEGIVELRCPWAVKHRGRWKLTQNDHFHVYGSPAAVAALSELLPGGEADGALRRAARDRIKELLAVGRRLLGEAETL